jgi:hypothetical protein
VKILVDIWMEHYDRIVAQVDRDSRLYAILMNGVVVYDRQSATPKKMVKVLCENSEAGIILDAAKNLCPEAACDIEQSIALCRTLSTAFQKLSF